MAILLSSANESVITRWESLLGGQYPLEQATLLRKLQSRCTEKKFELILLHRPLVDMAAFSELRKASPLSKFFLLSDQPNEEEGIAFLKLGLRTSRRRLFERRLFLAGTFIMLTRSTVTS